MYRPEDLKPHATWLLPNGDITRLRAEDAVRRYSSSFIFNPWPEPYQRLHRADPAHEINLAVFVGSVPITLSGDVAGYNDPRTPMQRLAARVAKAGRALSADRPSGHPTAYRAIEDQRWAAEESAITIAEGLADPGMPPIAGVLLDYIALDDPDALGVFYHVLDNRLDPEIDVYLNSLGPAPSLRTDVESYFRQRTVGWKAEKLPLEIEHRNFRDAFADVWRNPDDTTSFPGGVEYCYSRAADRLIIEIGIPPELESNRPAARRYLRRWMPLFPLLRQSVLPELTGGTGRPRFAWQLRDDSREWNENTPESYRLFDELASFEPFGDPWESDGLYFRRGLQLPRDFPPEAHQFAHRILIWNPEEQPSEFRDAFLNLHVEIPGASHVIVNAAY